MELERRTFELKEMRVAAAADDQPTKIEGYAAVFNVLSDDLGGFREKIIPGAFAESILVDDVRALFNHDPNYVLGRNISGTLQLAEDDHGLKISITPPDTQWARDITELIRRGDVDQMSFGFITISDQWHEEEGKTTRDLIKVKLFDLSPVTFPAYPQTVVAARDILSNKPAITQEGEPDKTEETQARARLDNLRKKLDLAEME